MKVKCRLVNASKTSRTAQQRDVRLPAPALCLSTRSVCFHPSAPSLHTVRSSSATITHLSVLRVSTTKRKFTMSWPEPLSKSLVRFDPANFEATENQYFVVYRDDLYTSVLRLSKPSQTVVPATSLIENLPDECLLQIIDELAKTPAGPLETTRKSVRNLSLVNKHFRELCHSQLFTHDKIRFDQDYSELTHGALQAVTISPHVVHSLK